ncbi:MAG: hypothetical protein O7B99_12815, partial [Planctomycetota bacterium]|nr:hypothetical protein [Planctomycetota bacterium]
YKSEFILRFRHDKATDSAPYLEVMTQMAKRSNMLHIEPSGDGNTMQLTYDIVLREDRTAQDLSMAISVIPGISEVVLIASKSDVDY